eukprot:gene24010-biopygen17882
MIMELSIYDAYFPPPSCRQGARAAAPFLWEQDKCHARATPASPRPKVAYTPRHIRAMAAPRQCPVPPGRNCAPASGPRPVHVRCRFSLGVATPPDTQVGGQQGWSRRLHSIIGWWGGGTDLHMRNASNRKASGTAKEKASHPACSCNRIPPFPYRSHDTPGPRALRKTGGGAALWPPRFTTKRAMAFTVGIWKVWFPTAATCMAPRATPTSRLRSATPKLFRRWCANDGRMSGRSSAAAAQETLHSSSSVWVYSLTTDEDCSICPSCRIVLTVPDLRPSGGHQTGSLARAEWLRQMKTPGPQRVTRPNVVQSSHGGGAGDDT